MKSRISEYAESCPGTAARSLRRQHPVVENVGIGAASVDVVLLAV